MMFDLFPFGKPFNLRLSMRIPRPAKVRLTVFDPNNGRIYAQRRLNIGYSTDVLVKLPIVPDELTTRIVNEERPDAPDQFAIEKIEVMPDTQCPLELTEGDRKFISFIKWFAVELSRLEAGEKGTLYQSGGYSILYLDTIRDSGIELTTPARIDRDSGLIEVSKKAIADYTVPMLMVVFLHEYAHKYKNHEYGKDMTNELAADLIACHIALNLGFDLKEVENCFRAVFAKKNTDLNQRRMKAVSMFISLFKKNEKQRCNTRNHANRPK